MNTTQSAAQEDENPSGMSTNMTGVGAKQDTGTSGNSTPNAPPEDEDQNPSGMCVDNNGAGATQDNGTSGNSTPNAPPEDEDQNPVECVSTRMEQAPCRGTRKMG